MSNTVRIEGAVKERIKGSCKRLGMTYSQYISLLIYVYMADATDYAPHPVKDRDASIRVDDKDHAIIHREAARLGVSGNEFICSVYYCYYDQVITSEAGQLFEERRRQKYEDVFHDRMKSYRKRMYDTAKHEYRTAGAIRALWPDGDYDEATVRFWNKCLDDLRTMIENEANDDLRETLTRKWGQLRRVEDASQLKRIVQHYTRQAIDGIRRVDGPRRGNNGPKRIEYDSGKGVHDGSYDGT